RLREQIADERVEPRVRRQRRRVDARLRGPRRVALERQQLRPRHHRLRRMRLAATATATAASDDREPGDHDAQGPHAPSIAAGACTLLPRCRYDSWYGLATGSRGA